MLNSIQPGREKRSEFKFLFKKKTNNNIDEIKKSERER